MRAKNSLRPRPAPRSGEPFDLFFDLAVDLLAVAGLDGYFHRVSRSAEEILGYSSGELVGQPFLDMTPPEERERVWEIFARMARGETIRDFTTQFRCKDGSYRWIQWNASAPAGDGLTYMAGRDITEQKEADQRLKHTLAEVEQARKRSERQAIELAKQAAELALARESAEEAARLKGSFLATMSHEIRTPMNGVLGMVSLMEEADLSEENREFLETIRVSGESLLEIINDVLDYSKTDAGKTRFASTPFELARCCEEAADMLAARAAAKQLDLSVFVSPACPLELRGDPGRLRQVLVNLVGNALKFTEAGSVAVRVERVRPSEGLLHFEVIDTGIGIPRNVLPHLFRPFMQADSGTTRRFGGTGLGLAICKQIVEALGGRIGAFSEPGRGATFWFELDLPVAKEGAAETCGAAGTRVLVLARTPSLRETLQQYLASWGAEVDLAGSLEAAAEEALPTLLLAEAGAPAGFSVEEIAALRDRRSGVRAAVVTWPGARQIEAARALNLEALYRPVKRRRLLSWVSGQVPGSKTAEDSPEPCRSLRVLVAEDNPVNQRIILKMLERLGHDAALAVNGREAVDRSRAERFDLVLMDCQMPEMDGFQAARQIRRESDTPPIVALTANALEGDRQRCLDAGMDDYLTKPIDLKALDAALRRFERPAATAEPV